MKNKKQINVSIPSYMYERFIRLYKGCLTRFITNCIKRALNDKNFFSSVFFDEV